MKSLLVLLIVVASIPLISSTESDIPSVESVETATQISSSEELNDAENPTEEIKLVEDSKNETDKGLRTSPKKLTCLPLKGLNITSEDENRVEVLNGTALISVLNEQSNSNVTNRTTPAICSLVLFYAPWCPFSARAAPHYNALARLYPDLVLMAVDANRHHAFTTQFGVLALPTILLFHNAKTFIKFNQTDFELDNFTTFLTTFTGIEPISGDLIIMESDMEGPMSSKFVPETDIYLHMSWAFVIICALGYFGKSSFCQNIIETMRNNWREAEIQHEHND